MIAFPVGEPVGLVWGAAGVLVSLVGYVKLSLLVFGGMTLNYVHTKCCSSTGIEWVTELRERS